MNGMSVVAMLVGWCVVICNWLGASYNLVA